jgi:hypothetical protein
MRKTRSLDAGRQVEIQDFPGFYFAPSAVQFLSINKLVFVQSLNLFKPGKTLAGNP